MMKTVATATIITLSALWIPGDVTTSRAGNAPAAPLPPAIAAGMRAAAPDANEPTPVPLVRAVYEIEVYGGMAVGTLTQEFAGDGDADRSGVYDCSIQGNVELTRIEAESGNWVGELRFETNPQVPSVASRRGAAQGGAEPGARFSTESFELIADEPTRVRNVFRMPIPLEGRTFTLTLPAIRDAHATGTGAGSEQPEGEDAGVPVRIVVTVHHEEPLLVAQSRTHPILVDFAGDRSIIETTEREVSGDSPFELQYAVNTEHAPTVAGYLRRDDDGRNGVEALLLPPKLPYDQAIRPKQVLFVVDSSGSMAHESKIVQARRAVSSCVDKLRPEDRFNIMEFDTDFTLMNPAPVERAGWTTDAVAAWLEDVQADGGTKLLPALKAILTQPEDPERHRMIVVVTDGILSDEKPVLALLEAELGDGRLFVVGTGRQHRQETLLRLAEYGRGAATFAGDADSLEAAVAELFDSIADPLGWDLKVELDGSEVQEIVPSRLPDLYSGRPVRVLAWYDGAQPHALRLRMSTVEGERLFDVKLPPR